MPVGGVAGQPGAFQAQHDPGPAEGDLGDQLLESFPVGGAGAGLALVDVDDGDLVCGPAQADRVAAQVVLADRGLGVVRDLLEAGLPNIEQGGPGEMGGGHLRGGGVGEHGCSFPRPGAGSWLQDGSGAGQRDGEPGKGVDELGGHRSGRQPWRQSGRRWRPCRGWCAGQVGKGVPPGGDALAGEHAEAKRERGGACVQGGMAQFLVAGVEPAAGCMSLAGIRAGGGRAWFSSRGAR